MIKVNLLNPEKKEVAGGKGPEAASFETERENKLNIGAIIVASVITVAIIGYLYYTQSQNIAQREALLLEKQARKTQLENVLKTVADLEKTKANLERKVKLITDLKDRQQDVVKMMDELLNALPDWVWLSNLNFSNRSLTLRGKTLGNNLISDFINNLKGTAVFTDIEFPGSTRQREGTMDIFNFSLKCKYRDKNDKDKIKSTDTNKKAG
ncbi:MAG: PilN domain-containing protein [Candidatus Omnitrophota bacterium]